VAARRARDGSLLGEVIWVQGVDDVLLQSSFHQQPDHRLEQQRECTNKNYYKVEQNMSDME
jgi:hypothetical protein